VPKQLDLPFTSIPGGGYAANVLLRADLGWKHAADVVKKRFGLSVKVAGVGLGLEWADVYLDWDEKRGVDEDRCVLVRPDYFVVWRAQESGDEMDRLVKVIGHILGFAGDEIGSNRVEKNGAGHSIKL
jgi:hypothetical protein